jgi:hypothetical protein
MMEIWTIDRPLRTEVLRRVVRAAKGVWTEGTYEMARDVWTDSESIYQHWGMWVSLWRSMPEPHCTMDADERAVFDALPDEITIYRGYAKGHVRLGLSWTLDRDRAEWFARRFSLLGYEPRLVTATIPKTQAFAFFNSRSEREIVALVKASQARDVESVNALAS